MEVDASASVVAGLADRREHAAQRSKTKARSRRHISMGLSNVPLLSCGRIQKTRSCRRAQPEPVVHHHGREGDGSGLDEVRPPVS